MGKVTDALLRKVATISDKTYTEDIDLCWVWVGKPDREKFENMQYPGDTETEQ